MKAVRRTSGDFVAHYLVDDPESWREEIRIHEGISLERLEYEEVPDPVPGPGEVLVEIGGCGLNHHDVWAIKSPPSHPLTEPRVLGADVAGVVVSVGDGVTVVKPSDRVLLYPSVSCQRCPFCLTGRDDLCQSKDHLGGSLDGGLAEYVVVPEWNVLPLPESISLVDGASLPTVFVTSWHMLDARVRVRPGDTVLVNAAGSGVGIAAIQIAHLFGARVLASAGSDPKLAKARELGAEGCINYATHHLYDEVMKLTGGRGVDVVIDSLSGELMEQSVEALAPGGRLVACGSTLGNWARVNVGRMLRKETSVMGSYFGSKGELLQVVQHVSEGRLRAVVDRVFPLSETRRVVEYLAERKQFGKVVVVPDSR